MQAVHTSVLPTIIIFKANCGYNRYDILGLSPIARLRSVKHHTKDESLGHW
jgi:hypothetical protein